MADERERGASPLRPTSRFSDRVDLYVRYRPGYPATAIEHLERAAGIGPCAAIADVGSGTGILSALLLARGHVVHAVEPNEPMRRAAESALGSHERFRSVVGCAEQTGLPPASVDLVVAAQAFHWFRIDEARREFGRILRPGSPVGLLWNRRRTEGRFLEAYEQLLQSSATDYPEIDHRKTAGPAQLAWFFVSSGYHTETFPNEQVLDWDGLRGRALSSSYVPGPHHPAHGAFMSDLRRIFDDGSRNGRVTIRYETEIHVGLLEQPRA